MHYVFQISFSILNLDKAILGFTAFKIVNALKKHKFSKLFLHRRNSSSNRP